VIWVVDGSTPPEELERLRTISRAWREEHPEPTVNLIVIYPTQTTMDAAQRKVAAKFIDETKHTRVASATAVLATGMVGALHRSLLTGLSILVPPPHPVKITARVVDAVDFLHPHIEQTCGPVSAAHVEMMVYDLHS